MKFYLNVRKCLFAGRVVNHGSRLPSEAEEFPSLEMMSGHGHEQPALGRAGWGWPRSDQSQGAPGCCRDAQLLGEARQGIVRLDIGEEKIGESELRQSSWEN